MSRIQPLVKVKDNLHLNVVDPRLLDLDHLRLSVHLLGRFCRAEVWGGAERLCAIRCLLRTVHRAKLNR